MDNEESSIFSTSSIILFAILIVVALFFLFPGNKLLEEVNKGAVVDQTSIQYLETLLDKTPDDSHLRMRLANELYILGLLEESEKTANMLVLGKDVQQANEARLLILKIQLRHYFEIPSEIEKSKKKQQLIATINQIFPKLTSIKRLEMLVKWSYELGEPKIAAKIYQYIVELLAHNKEKPDLKVTSKLNISFFLGINTAYASPTIKRIDVFAIKHLQALMDANKLDDAFHWSEKYVIQFGDSTILLDKAIKIAGFSGHSIQVRDWGRLYLNLQGMDDLLLEQQISRERAANDPENSLQWALAIINKGKGKERLFDFSSELAKGLGKNTLAKQLGLKQLQLKPNNLVLIDKQIQYELASKSLGTALIYAKRRVALDSENSIKAHQQLANIALWTNKLDITLQQWTWLYLNTKDEKYLFDALKLSKALFKYNIAADLYSELSRHRRLNDKELVGFYQVLQSAGFGDAGEPYFQAYLKRHPLNRQAWLYLMATQESTGHYLQAANTVQQIQEKFGTTPHLIKQQAIFLSRLGQFGQAWEQLNKMDVLTSIAPDNIDFWQVYTQIAWISGHEREGMKAYQNLLLNHALDTRMQSRLSLISKSINPAAKHLKLLVTMFDNTNNTEYILDALDLSLVTKNFEKTDELLNKVEKNPASFTHQARYWVIKATVANRQGYQLQAKQYLQKALALNNESSNIRVSLLWHLISNDTNEDDLLPFLQSTLPLAGSDSNLWEPIATGYRLLGKLNKALYWFARAVQKKPDDYLLLMAYADTLNSAGQYKKSQSIRHFILTSVRPKVMATIKDKTGIGHAVFKRNYVNIIRHEMGAESAKKWFLWLEKQHPKAQQGVFEEYRISWLLANNRMNDTTRHYMLKALHKNITLPSWQKLALAIHENETEEIEKLRIQNKNLSPTDKMVILSSIGRETHALNEAIRNMNDTAQPKEIDILSLLQYEMSLKVPPYSNIK